MCINNKFPGKREPSICWTSPLGQKGWITTTLTKLIAKHHWPHNKLPFFVGIPCVPAWYKFLLTPGQNCSSDDIILSSLGTCSPKPGLYPLSPSHSQKNNLPVRREVKKKGFARLFEYLWRRVPQVVGVLCERAWICRTWTVCACKCVGSRVWASKSTAAVITLPQSGAAASY
jgi:hypothetical protein